VPDSEAIVQVVRDQLALKPPEAPSLSVPELRAALHAGWLRMRFQPILNAATLRPVGLEALARLHHPVLGILHPRDFLSQAVESGQERAFAGITAARSLLELRALATPEAVELLQHLRFALNVPLTTFCQPYAVDRARHLCEVAAVPGGARPGCPGRFGESLARGRLRRRHR
jgi:EAL domain-containing protein (putative c-di-GMP-specific phosphodiesterase class I)